jgi:hypothetical protein
MKKKSSKAVPDFSRHTPTSAEQRPAPGKKGGQAPVRPPSVKPQATSSKSGRRGQ